MCILGLMKSMNYRISKMWTTTVVLVLCITSAVATPTPEVPTPEDHQIIMANDYIIYKWHLWFGAIDINHKGQISAADVQQEGESFSKLSHVDAERRKEILAKLHKLWNEYVFRGKTGPINEEEFIEMNRHQYEADKAKFQAGMRKCYSSFFSDIIDVYHEGFVTEEEFVNLMKACGHENVALVKMLFSFYNPVGGKVPSQVLVDSWVQFLTSDDSSQNDVVKTALEAGI
ncbi:sarcoplasmic calcium-binding protein-like [Mercenaria mercenaria]|uniref:sarcoplasmic calcium-binding protein-like n=1 Tax=Mercenaria mercenaria TaxID=6596 RepID=UPI00234EF36A|nr:sarcoplasmic calcium-binding protein-like [Mercenaria mercenaria]